MFFWLLNEHQIQEFLDGNGNASGDFSCLKLPEPSIDDLSRQFPLGNCCVE